MTFREKMHQRLVSCGMMKDHATAIIELAIACPSLEDMQNAWDASASGYHPRRIADIWAVIKTRALEWIDENLPEAWYRSAFI